MKPFLALLTAVVGIAIAILTVSCGGGGGDTQEAEQVAQPVAQPQQNEASEQAAVEQPTEQQVAPAPADQADPQQEADEEQAEPAPPPNRAPIANAGTDGAYDLRPGQVVLDGSGSRDPDGDRLTYEWAQTAGPAVTLRNAASAEARFDSPRTEQRLTFQLRVTDESGASDTDTLTLAFVNAPPTAEAGSNQQIERGQEVTLRGAGSDDASEDSLTYTWSQTSGPPVELSDAAAATPSFTAPNELETLVFSLTVNDGEYDSVADTVTITIRNLPPVADAGILQTVGHGARVTLDGSGSRDDDGDSITYEWTQVLGEEVSLSNPAAAKPSFTAPQKGQVLSFRLVVSDGTESAVDTVRVAVSYEPAVASNFETATIWTPVLYEAKEDAFTGDVRTDVRMRGPNGDLMLDVVCFESGSAAIGFRLLSLERDAGFANRLEVIWRLDDGEVMSRMLNVEYLGTRPALYFQNASGGFEFESSWPQVLEGGSLAVRIGYRGVHEDVFDLDAFAKTPVHGNLVNCGSY